MRSSSPGQVTTHRRKEIGKSREVREGCCEKWYLRWVLNGEEDRHELGKQGRSACAVAVWWEKAKRVGIKRKPVAHWEMGRGARPSWRAHAEELCLCLKSSGKPLEEVKQEDDLIRITFSQPSVWMQCGDWIRGHPEGSGQTSWDVRNKLLLLSGCGS